MRILTPYRMTRYEWPSCWFFEWSLDWTLVGFCVEVSLGNEGYYGHEYGVDFQLGPLYVEGGFCRKFTLLHPQRNDPNG